MSNQFIIDDRMNPGVGGVIKIIQGQKHHWDEAFKEWIDNSIGANAKNILILRTEDALEIIDDGIGCSDIKLMVSIAKSGMRSDDLACKYGIGGKMSQIRACISTDGYVEVYSIHKDVTSEIAIDWNQCVQQDAMGLANFNQCPTLRGSKTGTRIKIRNAKRFYKPNQLMEEIGHFYAGEILNHGKTIAFEINGTRTIVRPYKAPPFEGKPVRFEIDYHGHHIKGLCGVVKPGVVNRYPGWSVHWGYRLVKVTQEPAGQHLVNRIYGEVHLPRTWKDINVTKDDFTSDVDDLMERIGELCSEVIERGDMQSSDFVLNETSQIAGDLLTGAIAGGQERVKGRRPGRGGKSGTVTPSGNGSAHRNFTICQPGDKSGTFVGGVGHVKIPNRIRIAWDNLDDRVYRVDVVGTNPRTMTITLNNRNPCMIVFKDDPFKLAIECCAHIAYELTNNPGFDGILPAFKREGYHDTYQELLSSLSKNQAVGINP